MTTAISTPTKRVTKNKATFNDIYRNGGYILSLLAIFIFVAFPIFWISISAFKLPKDVTKPTIIFQPTFDNFKILFELFDFQNLIINSLIVCIAVVVITLPLATSGAYALSRFKLPFKRLLLVLVLATQFFPPVVMVLPYFNIFRTLQLLDTYTALVIVNLTRTIPFAMWLLFGFIDTLPSQIEEAAMVDGCTEWGILRYVTFPLALPGIITAGVFSFLLAWNEFLYAFLLTTKDTRTVIVGLVNVVGERDVPWEQMSAAGLIVMIPMLIMAYGIRRYFVEGMTMGAVK
ncbi:MAG: carbohydrate ABC transporter permease [Chloroflexi bacterium]|nr:MAG: carbohydrate ABC transporter permease [Chloroflexota bacterium]